MRKKKKSILIDTNVLVAIIDKKDVYNQYIVDFIKANNPDFKILQPILAEAYSVIVRRCRERKYDCKEAVKAIERYENFLTIVSPKINHSEVVNNLKINPSLNYNDWLLLLNDWLLLLYALKHKIEILSFDKALIEEYKKYSVNEGRS